MAANNPFATVARLSQIALAVKPEGMIADMACPRIPVDDEQFIYTQHNVEDRFTIVNDKIGRKSEPNEVEFGGTDIEASTQDHGLSDFVPQKDLDRYASGATNIDPTLSAVEGTAGLVDLGREKRVADLYGSLNTYASNLRTTLSGVSQWSDYEHSTPIKDIKQAADSMLVRPNYLIVNRDVATVLEMHPGCVAAVLGALAVGATASATGVISLDTLARVLGLRGILVGETWYNSAKPGQAAVMARLWGKHATLVRIDPSVRNVRGGAMPTFAATAEWRSRRTRIVPEPKRGVAGGNSYIVTESLKELVLWQGCGYHFHDAVA